MHLCTLVGGTCTLGGTRTLGSGTCILDSGTCTLGRSICTPDSGTCTLGGPGTHTHTRSHCYRLARPHRSETVQTKQHLAHRWWCPPRVRSIPPPDRRPRPAAVLGLTGLSSGWAERQHPRGYCGREAENTASGDGLNRRRAVGYQAPVGGEADSGGLGRTSAEHSLSCALYCFMF